MHRLFTILVFAAIAWPSPAAAQATFQRGWIDVNLGIASPAESTFEMSLAAPLDFEVARAEAGFNLPIGASFDVGGGVMLTPVFGLGVSLTGTAHQDPASLAIDVPHPLYFNAFAFDSAVTDRPLERTEGGFNIQIMIVAADRGDFRFRIFGGPSYLRVEQEGVDVIEYGQLFGIFTTANAVDITGFTARKTEGTGWGVHAGADASFFFSRVAGVGGFVRYMGGTVEIEDTLGGGTIDVKAGGLQVGGGLRLRF